MHNLYKDPLHLQSSDKKLPDKSNPGRFFL